MESQSCPKQTKPKNKQSWVDIMDQTSNLELEEEDHILVGVFDAEGRLIDSYKKPK